MIRRPPRSTLFPTRRSSDLRGDDMSSTPRARARLLARSGRAQPGLFAPLVLAQAAEIEALPRSEEHTSELQSQSNLVCRLLLEKKKKLKDSKTLTTRSQQDR